MLLIGSINDQWWEHATHRKIYNTIVNCAFAIDAMLIFIAKYYFVFL